MTWCCDSEKPVSRAGARGGRASLLGRAGVRALSLTAAMLLILLVLLILVARVGLPLLDGHAGAIEAELTKRLRVPVSIGELALRWRGRGPELYAAGVEVGAPGPDRAGVDEVRLGVDVASSLRRRELVVGELALVGADVVLERRADGTLGVVGLDLPDVDLPDAGLMDADESRGDPKVLGWLFDARRIDLLDSRIDILDRRGGRRFALDALDVGIENEPGSHRLRLDATLPDDLGGAIHLGVDLASDAEGLLAGDAEGTFTASVDRLGLGALAALLEGDDGKLALPRALDGLGGRLDADLQGRIDDGGIAAATGSVELAVPRPDATGRAADPVTEIPRDALSADLTWRRLAGNDGWTLAAQALRLRRGGAEATLPEKTLPETTLPGASLRHDATGTVLDAGGDALDVAALAALPGTLHAALPGVVGEALARWSGEAAPRGGIEDWRLRARFGAGTPSFDVEASVRALAFDAVAQVPGVAGLDVDVAIESSRGRLRLSGAPGGVAYDAPRMRADALAIDSLVADLGVDFHDPAALRIEGPLSLGIASASAEGRLALALERGASPLVDLQGGFTVGDVADIRARLPDRSLPPGVLRWLDRALVGGEVRRGDFLFRGRAADFPFDDGAGVFRVGMDARDVTLDWLPGWPRARGATGRVEFDGFGFEALVESGELGALTVDGLRVSIADLRRPALKVEGSGEGELARLLTFAKTGPLRDLLEPALEELSGDGEAGLDLGLRLSLVPETEEEILATLDLEGAVFLSGNDVRVEVADLDLEDARGAIGFDQDGIFVHRLKASWLGRPLVLDADMRGEGRSREAVLQVSGRLSARRVLEHYGLPLAGHARGESAWNVVLVAPFDAERASEEGVGFEARSELVGTGIELPAPLAKPAPVTRPLAIRASFRPEERVVRWTIDHGARLQGVADVTGDELLSLALGLGGTPANRVGLPGVRLDGTADAIDLDGWVEVIATLIEELPESSGTPEKILPVSIELGTAGLSLRRASLGPAQLRVNSDARYLNAVLENEHLRANARYPREHWTRTDPALVRIATVDEITIDALRGEAEDAFAAANPDLAVPEGDHARGGLDPRELPPVEARIAALRYGRLALDDLVLRTEPDVAGLDITAVGFTHEDLQLLGSGYWRLADPQGFDATRDGAHLTRLDLTLQSSDFGNGLADVGLGGVLSESAGRVTSELRWEGPAWYPDVEIMDGEFSIDLQDGHITQVDPGVGRLLGLFAFQALPRRLSLDFSDVTEDGLAFNALAGGASMTNGIVDSPLVQLTGPVGVVDVSGRTDLVKREFDQRITVLPRVSAALPIIGAITGGATAGVGVLLAGGLLKALGIDLDRIGLREYSLTGSFERPEFLPAP